VGRIGLGREMGLADVPGLDNVKGLGVRAPTCQDPSSVPCLGLPRIFLAARLRWRREPTRSSSSTAIQPSTQNWHGPGESDCIIITKHCDGPRGC